MSFSEVQICNIALHKFGNLSIASLNDNTKEARACKVFYPLCRDLVMQGHGWNFAMKRADISAQLTTTPAFEWDYAYTLPADCLRVWEFYGSDAEWTVENGIFLTNEDEEIYIRYIFQETLTGKFPPSFCYCVAQMLASELAPKLANDFNMRTVLLQELNSVWLPMAYQLNAIEGNRPLTAGEKGLDSGNFAWQTEGR